MKKLLLIVTIAISSFSFGQITLEHTYTTEGFNNYPKSYAFHTDNGLFLYLTFASSNLSFILTTPSGATLWSQ